MSLLVSYLPNVTLRRSERLQAKNVQTYTHLYSLPLELKFLIFKYLTVEELSLLTITSKALREVVDLYMNCKWAPQLKIVRELKHGSLFAENEYKYEAEFQRLGLYIKRSTCLYTTDERLRLIQQFLQMSLRRFSVNYRKPTNCIVLKYFGIFLHTVIAGWDESECCTVFDYIADCSNVRQYVADVVQRGPCLFLTREMYIRLYLRHIFIDRCQCKADMVFWIDLILRPYSANEQAHLLYILFGPISGDMIQWFSPSMETDMLQSDCAFGELGSVLRLLFFYKGWSERTIFNIIDNLMCTPDEWRSLNKAILLYYCGESLAVKVLSRYAENGERRNMADILASLCLVTMNCCHSVSWVIKVIRNVCEEVEANDEPLNLVNQIIDTFKLMIEMFYDAVVLDADTSRDIHSVLNAQAAFAKELALLAFNTV